MTKRFPQVFILLFLSYSLAHAAWPEDEVNYWDDMILKKAGISLAPNEIQKWLRTRIPNLSTESNAAKWVLELGNENFEIREQASKELLKLNNLAIFELKKALKSNDVEVVKRASDCLEKISPNESTALKCAVIRLLGKSDPRLVFEYFSKIAETPELDLMTSEAILDAFNSSIKTNTSLVKLLEDFPGPKNPNARIIIARTLAKGNPKGPAFKKLAENDAPIIRANAALALLQEKDKNAVGLLISLLSELKTNQMAPIACMLNELIEDKNSEMEIKKKNPSSIAIKNSLQEAWNKKNNHLELSRYSPVQLMPRRILVSLAEVNLSGKICSLNPDGSISEIFRCPSYASHAHAINHSLILLIEKSRGQLVVNNAGETLERNSPLISVLAINIDETGKRQILNRQNLTVMDHTNKVLQNIEFKNDCLTGTRLTNGDYAVIFKDNSLVILNGKDLNKVKATFSLGPKESARTILGHQIEVTKSGSLLVPEQSGKIIKEYDQTGKLLKTINSNINTVGSTIYGQTFIINTNGNYLMGTSRGQTIIELNSDGMEIRNWDLNSKLYRIFSQPLGIIWAS